MITVIKSTEWQGNCEKHDNRKRGLKVQRKWKNLIMSGVSLEVSFCTHKGCLQTEKDLPGNAFWIVLFILFHAFWMAAGRYQFICYVCWIVIITVDKSYICFHCLSTYTLLYCEKMTIFWAALQPYFTTQTLPTVPYRWLYAGWCAFSSWAGCWCICAGRHHIPQQQGSVVAPLQHAP